MTPKLHTNSIWTGPDPSTTKDGKSPELPAPARVELKSVVPYPDPMAKMPSGYILGGNGGSIEKCSS